MNDKLTNQVVDEIAAAIEIPESSYETAEQRYKDLGNWFGRPESKCYGFDPHIHPQGSFRLGTAIRPLNADEKYDLDLTCKLESGVDKLVHTQQQIKELVGADVESYRVARGIKEEKEEKHRCWRLEYADQLGFHIDIVPCIPESLDHRLLIKEEMIRAGAADTLAETVANLTVNITDNRHVNYQRTSADWSISNPEGYARWFESRMKLATLLLEKRAFEAKAATVDALPVFKWKTPLQRCVQVLKRHRDIMFADNPEVKPISIIITTLAARAYRGEADIGDAMQRVLTDMRGLVNSVKPRVPNPVHPAEDFADKWSTTDGRAKKLEENFWLWLAQAQSDFKVIASSTNVDFISEQAMEKFGSALNAKEFRRKYGLTTSAVAASPKIHHITETPAKPWCR